MFQPRVYSVATFFLLAAWAAALTAGPPLRRVDVRPQQGLATAVVVSDCSLLHTSQLFPYAPGRAIDSGDLAGQFDQLMTNLDLVLKHRGAARSDVVKVNFYTASAEAADLVRTRLSEWFGPNDLPAVSYVQTRLPYEEAALALNAVVAVKPLAGSEPLWVRLEGLDARPAPATYSVLPLGDVVYVAGQAESGTLATATADTLEGLQRTLQYLGLGREHIAEIKCFLDPMSEIEVVDEQISNFFGEGRTPPVSHVEWVAGSLPIEIELVAYAPPAESADTIAITTPPWMTASPVYSRVTRLFGNRRIYLSGLYAAEEGDGERQVRDIFAAMRTTLDRAGSDFRHLAKATYYVSDNDASRKLNELRPDYYDPARPPAASKAMVKGVARTGRSITIDMIAAPAPQ